MRFTLRERTQEEIEKIKKEDMMNSRIVKVINIGAIKWCSKLQWCAFDKKHLTKMRYYVIITLRGGYGFNKKNVR